MATSHRELTADSLRLLFELLRAADWVMLPAIEGNPAIVAVSGRAKGLGDKFPEVVCGSAEELGAVLIKGIVEWKRYRDQIVDG